MNFKLISIFTTALVLFTTSLFAVETKVGGFVALDLVTLTDRYWDEESEGEYGFGIGTVSLKVKSYVDDTSFKVKLDIDSRYIDGSYNLIEELVVGQKLTDNFTIKAGKGIVAFHNKHYGVVKDSYFDGGTVLGYGLINFDDQDRRIFISTVCGGYKSGYRNTFSLYAKEDMDQSKGLNAAGNEKYKYTTAKNVDPENQIGVANKFEYYMTKEITTSVAGLIYMHKQNPHTNYAVDLGAKYRTADLEGWFEAQYGKSSLDNGEDDPVENKKELVAQVGAEYYIISQKVSLLTDIEYASVKYNEVGSTTEVAASYAKAEAGVGYKFNKHTKLTTGLLLETMENDAWEDNKKAYMVKSGVTYYF
jgi:hypothetical protein